MALDAVADAERDRSSRVHTGEVDCVRCDARGFRLIPEGEPGAGGFEWCAICEERGRVPLCHSARGYFAVAKAALADFLAGQRDPGDFEVVFLGTAAPAAHRYPPPPED